MEVSTAQRLQDVGNPLLPQLRDLWLVRHVGFNLGVLLNKHNEVTDVQALNLWAIGLLDLAPVDEFLGPMEDIREKI